jgi:EAL domain-containing protein (putative c-di-GMP-specific phosphodiesterase class I)
MFDNHKLEMGSVALEITENSLVESFEDTREKLKKLREKGILIYLDDFGKGYSSLTYLKNLPIDVVKIDKLFVDDIISEGTEKSIIKSIISLASDIGLKVVAEGVEEEIQREYLAMYKCCYIQGYLISKPVPEKLAVELLIDD